ncbi:MAG: pectin acetylesterase-family hydrolase [Deltaproteobacteria bacterium]|nr:pectin acetylesterase-family hydrolase [Deltaproteobacteria bacterium]
MRMRSIVLLSALALLAAACGSDDNDHPKATPTTTRTAVATATATVPPTATATAARTATSPPTATATRPSTATPTATAPPTDTPTSAPTPTPDGERCARGAADALADCVAQLSQVERACYAAGGRACTDDSPALVAQLGALAGTVGAECPSDAAVHAAGFADPFSVAGLTTRLADACRADAASLAARSFGGPQGAALAGADADGKACLTAAQQAATALIVDDLGTYNTCLASGECDPPAVEAILQDHRNAAALAIDAACTNLAALVALDTGTFVSRAAAQARCLAATAHADASALGLDCGARPGLPDAPRGQYVQVVLDEAVYGTRCGDGSPYAFWVRLAPAGSPVENVVVGMQGGGVCIFGEDCATRPADLFEAMNDQPETGGPLSNDPQISPFADWTKVYLPYCNQDVFIGGGTTSNFDQITVHRFGAVNVRAALRVVRDLLWRSLDADTDGGYSPDKLRVLFGGFSAGGFGTIYNYHYLLDDLQWRHSVAYPDAGLALDNGEALGVAGLGLLLIADAPPLGWGALDYLPPYCFATNCGVGPVLLHATAPRLKEVPEQQMLILSNQVDDTQVATTFFDTLPDWVNALRTSYCDTHLLPGVQYFLPAITQSVHVISPRTELYTDYPIDGVLMRDWLQSGFTAPDAVTDHIEEGTLVDDIPGVEAIPCK